MGTPPNVVPGRSRLQRKSNMERFGRGQFEKTTDATRQLPRASYRAGLEIPKLAWAWAKTVTPRKRNVPTVPLPCALPKLYLKCRRSLNNAGHFGWCPPSPVAIAGGIRALQSRKRQCGLSDQDASQNIDAFSVLDDSGSVTLCGAKRDCPDTEPQHSKFSMYRVFPFFPLDNLEE